MENSYEAVVVGGSFAGLTAALQLARARRRVLVIDGGKPRNRFVAESHGFLGQDGRAPGAILDDARQQLLKYPTVTLHRGEAIDARKEANSFFLDVTGRGIVRTAQLVLATGVTDTLPEIPGLREAWGKSVFHCPYCHGYEVADRPLGVLYVGLGEMTAHQLSMLQDWSKQVTLFTANVFPLSQELRESFVARGYVVEPAPVIRVEEQGKQGILLHHAGGATTRLGALLVAPRSKITSPLYERLGCATEETWWGKYIQINEWKETSVPGVFAAGDAARPMHSVTLAVADGALAGVAAHHALIAARTPHS